MPRLEAVAAYASPARSSGDTHRSGDYLTVAAFQQLERRLATLLDVSQTREDDQRAAREAIQAFVDQRGADAFTTVVRSSDPLGVTLLGLAVGLPRADILAAAGARSA